MQRSVLFLLLQFFFNYNDFTNADDTDPAESNDLSFLVLLEWKEEVGDTPDRLHFCSGSLITQKHVLTAEHCLYQEEPWHIQVRVGITDIRSSKTYDVKSWTTYDKWASEANITIEYHDNDVAIIELIEEVYWNNVIPALMTRMRSTDFIDKIVMATGWGHHGKVHSRPEKVPLRVLSDAECKLKTIFNDGSFALQKNFMCTSSDNQVYLSKGDNGGPLVYNDELIGMNIWTYPQFVSLSNSKLVQNLHVTIEYYAYFIVSVSMVHSLKLDEDEPVKETDIVLPKVTRRKGRPGRTRN